MSDPTARLISHALETDYQHLPPRTIAAVKASLLDTLGAGLAGAATEMGSIASSISLGMEGRKQSTLWGSGKRRVPALEAAFSNAVAARCLELDDVHEGSPRVGSGHGGHVSVMTVPATLAALATIDHPISGQRLIAALAVGADLIPRLRMAAGASGRIGWEAPTVAPLGVAAAIANLLELDAETCTNAFGAAYAHCAGTVISTTDGSWDVWLNAGVAARAGLLAVELARRGHKGAKAPLTGRAGLYPLYFRGEYHEEALMGDLGRAFEAENISIKPYPCCKAVHHAIATVMGLRQLHNIGADDVARIDIRSSRYKMELTALDPDGSPKELPRTVSEAQFNMGYLVALALVRGNVFPEIFQEGVLRDAAVRRVFELVNISEGAEQNRLQEQEGYPPEDVELTLVDGRKLSARERHVPGHPLRPMSYFAVAEKFRRCVALMATPIPPVEVDGLIETVETLETFDDVRGLLG